MNFFVKFITDHPRRISRWFLHAGMITALTCLASILIHSSHSELPKYIIVHTLSPALEHIIMTATITITGALMIESASLER